MANLKGIIKNNSGKIIIGGLAALVGVGIGIQQFKRFDEWRAAHPPIEMENVQLSQFKFELLHSDYGPHNVLYSAATPDGKKITFNKEDVENLINSGQVPSAKGYSFIATPDYLAKSNKNSYSGSNLKAGQ